MPYNQHKNLFVDLNRILPSVGEITVNAKTVSQSQIKRISAYVQQNDNFVATLTVKEVMMFHVSFTSGKVKCELVK